MSGKDIKSGIKKDEDCTCYAKTRSSEDSCPPVRNVTHPLRYYEFTQDEIKLLEECDKESFYRRCLPFSTLFASITYAAIKYGFLKKSTHFGAVPKLMVAALLGHMVGRLSYLTHCDEKLRVRLPENSRLGCIMRQYYLENNPPPKKM